MTQVWATDPGINWDWFALINVNDDGTAEIVREGRLHNFDEWQGADQIAAFRRAAGGNKYWIEEIPTRAIGDRRMATGVRINQVLYPFAEPQPRWSFPDLKATPD